ncbi:hypothetical protein BT69DRAFT_1297317 [Atractiella rhizophila]|nr:hypothetical protein BT69DRAFT_1297317 [Atractiella rhizophila]
MKLNLPFIANHQLFMVSFRYMAKMKENFEKHANPVNFKVNDLVMVLDSTIHTQHSRKLEVRWFGPFKSVRKRGNIDGEELANVQSWILEPLTGVRIACHLFSSSSNVYEELHQIEIWEWKGKRKLTNVGEWVIVVKVEVIGEFGQSVRGWEEHLSASIEQRILMLSTNGTGGLDEDRFWNGAWAACWWMQKALLHLIQSVKKPRSVSQKVGNPPGSHLFVPAHASFSVSTMCRKMAEPTTTRPSWQRTLIDMVSGQCSTFNKAASLLHDLESTAEDNEDPFHLAFSGWRPTQADTGFQQGIKRLRTLWDALLLNASQVVPKVLLDAWKGDVCSAAQHIYVALAAEGLVNHVGEDTVFQDESEHSDVVLLDLEVEPPAREIDNDEVADNLQKKQGPKRRNKKQKICPHRT